MSKYDLIANYGGMLRHAVVDGDMMTFEDGSKSDLYAFINMDAGTCFIAMLFWQNAKTDAMTWAEHFNKVMYALCDNPDENTTSMVKAVHSSNVYMLDGGAYKLFNTTSTRQMWHKYDSGYGFMYDYVPVNSCSFIKSVEYMAGTYERTIIFTDDSRLTLGTDKTNFYKACDAYTNSIMAQTQAMGETIAGWFERYIWQLQRKQTAKVLVESEDSVALLDTTPIIKERTAHIAAICCGAFMVTLLILAYLINTRFGA